MARVAVFRLSVVFVQILHFTDAGLSVPCWVALPLSSAYCCGWTRTGPAQLLPLTARPCPVEVSANAAAAVPRTSVPAMAIIIAGLLNPMRIAIAGTLVLGTAAAAFADTSTG